jgi:hypothetical protein
MVVAADDFPVYTPRVQVRGPRADKDYPVVDTPTYKGAIVPAEEAARTSFLTNSYGGFWTPTTNDVAKAEASVH